MSVAVPHIVRVSEDTSMYGYWVHRDPNLPTIGLAENEGLQPVVDKACAVKFREPLFEPECIHRNPVHTGAA